MEQERYILLQTFCEHTRIEDGFVKRLHEYGLISFEKKQDDYFIAENDISEIEKMFRLHNDLNINYEGLDAIREMMKRMEKMENEINLLRKRLRLYE